MTPEEIAAKAKADAEAGTLPSDADNTTKEKPDERTAEEKYNDLEARFKETQSTLTKLQQAAKGAEDGEEGDEDGEEGDGTDSSGDDASEQKTGSPLTLTPKKSDKKVADQSASELLDGFLVEYEESGELSDKMKRALKKKGMSDEDATLLLDTKVQKAQNELSELLEPVGGAEAYAKISEWLTETMSEEEQADYNEGIQTGNKLVKSLLLGSAAAAYAAANGTAPKAKENGSNNKDDGKPATEYKSQTELANDMADPRWLKDAAYTNEVRAKASRSDQQLLQTGKASR